MSNRVHVRLELACIVGNVNVAIKADPNPYVEQMTSEAHIYDGHGEKLIKQGHRSVDKSHPDDNRWDVLCYAKITHKWKLACVTIRT